VPEDKKPDHQIVYLISTRLHAVSKLALPFSLTLATMFTLHPVRFNLNPVSFESEPNAIGAFGITFILWLSITMSNKSRIGHRRVGVSITFDPRRQDELLSAHAKYPSALHLVTPRIAFPWALRLLFSVFLICAKPQRAVSFAFLNHQPHIHET